MKSYKVLTNFVSRKYEVGDTFTEEEFSDKRMLEYHIKKCNVAEVIIAEKIINDTEDKKQRRNRREQTNIENISIEE